MDNKRDRSVDDGKAPDSIVSSLQKEVQELKVTNGVYLEKINELVDQLNQMDEEHYTLNEERTRQLLFLKKQNDELLSKLPENERNSISKTNISINTDQIKRGKVNNKIFTAKATGEGGDEESLRQENEALQQQLVLLKNKNMDLLNQLSDLKSRSRSRSDNRAK